MADTAPPLPDLGELELKSALISFKVLLYLPWTWAISAEIGHHGPGGLVDAHGDFQIAQSLISFFWEAMIF
jgi:hypothetical protein